MNVLPIVSLPLQTTSLWVSHLPKRIALAAFPRYLEIFVKAKLQSNRILFLKDFRPTKNALPPRCVNGSQDSVAMSYVASPNRL